MNLNFFLIQSIICGDIRTFMSLGILGEYAKSLFAYSPCTHRFFPRILQIHLKNEEYAERSFYVQQCPGILNGQCFKKMEWGVTYLPWMNSLQNLFFDYL